jgi:hypothetical protein
MRFNQDEISRPVGDLGVVRLAGGYAERRYRQNSRNPGPGLAWLDVPVQLVFAQLIGGSGAGPLR